MKKMRVIFSFILFSCLFQSACKNEVAEFAPNENTTSVETTELIEKLTLHTTNDGNIDTANLAKIVYEQNIFFFDTVKVGSIVSHSFSFTNLGKNNLFVLETQSSCGCTVADYNKEAIEPGESSNILIKFDTKGKKGHQKKQIIVFTNSYPNKSVLTLQGYVN